MHEWGAGDDPELPPEGIGLDDWGADREGALGDSLDPSEVGEGLWPCPGGRQDWGASAARDEKAGEN